MRMMKEMSSVEELVTHGEQEMQLLADAGNTVAREWLTRIQEQGTPLMKLSLFGQMRIELLSTMREPQEVLIRMFPTNGNDK